MTIRPCLRHEAWHVSCRVCCAWHRLRLQAERSDAVGLAGQSEAADAQNTERARPPLRLAC